MTLVEVEGTHTVQNSYSSIDVHVGQTYSVLVTMDQPSKDYYVVVSTRFPTTRFADKEITSTAILHYNDSTQMVPWEVPTEPAMGIEWSLYQARSIR